MFDAVDIALIFLLLMVVALAMMLQPHNKKRRVNRRQAPTQPARPAGVTGVLALINHEEGGFTAAHLEASWDNNLTGQNFTWRQRVQRAVLYWQDHVQNVRPSALISGHEYLRKKYAFYRTEAAFKRGMMSEIVYRCVFGSLAVFDRNTHSGGLLKSYEGSDVYKNIIVPLVTHICRFYNCQDYKGQDLLSVQAVLDENYGNWRKNLLLRSTAYGVYSNACVLESLRAAEEKNAADPPYDDSCCKGIYFPWYSLVAVHHKDFHNDTMKANAGHYLTEAENTEATWTAALSTAAFA